MVKKIFIIAFIAVLINGCSNDFVVDYLEFGDNSMLANASKLNDSTHKLLEGIYKTDNKLSRLGNQIVLKFNKNKLSIFCQKSYDYFILDAGVVDSGIVFEGNGRDLETTNTALARFFIHNDDGALDILAGKQPTTIIMKQYLFVNTQTNNQSSNFTLFKFEKKFTNDDNFYIIAHRAGGRNSDLLGPAENSLEMINLAGNLGANAIEIDIRLTNDKIPILFHDDFITNRLVKGDVLLGPIENYKLKHLKSFCTLLNDETIPTLEEALEEVIFKTNLKLVWLDIKSADVVDVIIPIVIKYKEIAKKNNRKLDFALGITNEEVLSEIKSNSDYGNFSTICELDKDIAKSTNSILWAPQWTMGLLNTDVDELDKLNINSVVWTLDDRKFIIEFLDNSNYSGILTNYSAIVAYEYYTRK